MQGLGKALGDVAGLVDLATLDRRMAAEGVADRLGQRLGPVDDEQAADRRLQATPDQVVEQRLHHGGILGRPLDHAEGMLLAVLYLSRSMDWFNVADGYPDLPTALAGIHLKSACVLGVDVGDIVQHPFD